LASSAISSRAACSVGSRRTGAPARLAALRSFAADGASLAFLRAFSITSSLSSVNEASVRLRGPFGVLCDSRTSNRPALVETTKAIVGESYH
jgi:hypothetical protein